VTCTMSQKRASLGMQHGPIFPLIEQIGLHLNIVCTFVLQCVSTFTNFLKQQ